MCLVLVEEDLPLGNSIIRLLEDELQGVHPLTSGPKILVLLSREAPSDNGKQNNRGSVRSRGTFGQWKAK